MKKLALALAIIMIAAFSVTPAMASTLKTKGSYRAVFNYTDKNPAADEDYWIDQRFRVQMDWKANDNVSAQLRMDIAEEKWGDFNGRDGDYDSNAKVGEIERAYAKIKGGVATTVIGIQSTSVGLGTMYDDQISGITSTIKINPVTLKFIYSVDNNNTDTTDMDDDTAVYAAQAAFKIAKATIGLATALENNDASQATTKKLGLSAWTVVPLTNKLKLSAEISSFSGDADDAATVDYAGTQIFARLDAKINAKFSAHVDVLYAADVDTDEVQATEIESNLKFLPFDFEGSLKMDAGLNLMGPSDDAASGTSSFDFGQTGTVTGATDTAALDGAGAGLFALIGAVKVAPINALTIYGKLAYATPVEDANTNLDSVMLVQANADYKVMPKVTLSAGLAYELPEFDDSTDDDAQVTGVVRLGVSF